MRADDRSPTLGMTSTQLRQFDADMREIRAWPRDSAQACAHLGDRYAVRAAALLVANDVRGALWYADLWAFAASQSRALMGSELYEQARSVVRQDPATAAARREQAITLQAESREVMEASDARRFAEAAHRVAAPRQGDRSPATPVDTPEHSPDAPELLRVNFDANPQRLKPRNTPKPARPKSRL